MTCDPPLCFALALVLLSLASGTSARRCHNGLIAAQNYASHPSCDPDTLEENVQCSALGSSVTIGGDLYKFWEFHYNLMADRYYFARMAEALGYQCPTNTTLLKEMDLVTPWSGIFGAIAVDGAYGFDRLILRRCVFPTATYPFLCTGSAGNPRTCGRELGTLSYVSLLHDEVNHRWTLFGHCWNAKTPENPNAQEKAVSFNVFSLDKTLPAADRVAIIAKLQSLGFNTNPSNIIEPDFTS